MNVNNNWIEIRDEEDRDILININAISSLYYIVDEFDGYCLCLNINDSSTIYVRFKSLLEVQMIYAKFKKILFKNNSDDIKEIQEFLDLRKEENNG